MNESDRRFWPFKPRISIVWTIVLFGGLSFMAAILQAKMDWPRAGSDTWVLVTVVVVSALPVVLAILDVIIERGGVIEYGRVKIDFSQVRRLGMASITVPVNIGVPGQSVTDSSTTAILDALRKATTCDVVIVNLEEGQAWWETRLLVLVAGAERLRKPDKIVFVATDSRKQERFQGWALPSELLGPLVRAHPQYLRSLLAARAAGRQWKLVEPVNPLNPAAPGAKPAQPPWIQGGLAGGHPWMAFDDATGLPNEFLTEQFLQSDLGANVEIPETPKGISLGRLIDLFGAVLKKDSIDLSWPAERQMGEFLNNDAAYIAVTESGKYSTIVSRLAVLNEVLRPLVLKKTAG